MTATAILNEFRTTDALEFSEAFRFVRTFPAPKDAIDPLKERLSDLSKRMKDIEAKGEEIPSYLLAAYRGYEYGKLVAEGYSPPMVVKVDDSIPSSRKSRELDSGMRV